MDKKIIFSLLIFEIILCMLITIICNEYDKLKDNYEQMEKRIITLEKNYKIYEINLKNIKKNAKVQLCKD